MSSVFDGVLDAVAPAVFEHVPGIGTTPRAVMCAFSHLHSAGLPSAVMKVESLTVSTIAFGPAVPFRDGPRGA